MSKRIVSLLLAAGLLLTGLSGCSGGGQSQVESSGVESVSSHLQSEASSHEEEESSAPSEAGTSSAAGGESQVSETPTQDTSSAQSETTAQSSSSPQVVSQPVQEIVTVTIPEGYTFMQIAQTLEEAGVCTAEEFYQAAQSYTVQSFTVPEDSNRCFKMEGYLFPDTYEFYTNDDPVDVLRKMLNNYAAKSGMPSDETLIIASIVEREARSSEEMAKVASVFYNRLEQGWKLEADPTREYVNDYITGNPLVADQSPYAALYNTYKCAGLPAGPICCPGAAAIAAAMNPADTDYLYFFFGNDNQNHYSTTLEEHTAAMEQYGVQYQ